MYKKFNKPRSNNNYEDKDFVPSRDSRPPVSEKDYDTTINMKVMKDLPQSSYGVKVDPYTEVNNPATPYNVISKFNKVMGGRYAGNENLGGGNLIQYNQAVDSGMLQAFDSLVAMIKLNYKYLPMKSTDNRGKEMVNQMRAAISEVVSSLNATTFRDQNIFKYVVHTDLPMGDAPYIYLKNPDNTWIMEYTIDPQTGARVRYPQPTGDDRTHCMKFYYNLEDVLYATCIYYQTTLQNVAQVFNMVNANRTRMGEMIKMSWNREVSALNSYFGLLKKKSFLAVFDSLALNLQGEYLDIDQMRQGNTFAMVASRRSECLNDPLLELAAYYEQPDDFDMYISGSGEKEYAVPLFESYYDMAFTTTNGQTATRHTFLETIQLLARRMTVEDTLSWARKDRATISDRNRYNEIEAMISGLINIFTTFKSKFTDLRTVLTIMARLGVVNWKLGTRLKITKDTSCEITNYLVVNNIYEMIFGGATSMTYNDTTKRWRTFSLWNVYFGIPEYASKQGGAFLSFCLKNLSTSVASSVNYLPIAFSLGIIGQNNAPVVAINRAGVEVSLYPQATTMSNTIVLSRLCPLSSQNGLQINVGHVYGVSNLTPLQKSYLYRLFLQIAGVGNINGDIACDPDTLAIYEYEIEDLTNMVISYCRGNGPFKVSEYTENELGFYGLSAGK